MRALLTRYAGGDVVGAVGILVAHPLEWMPDAVDEALTRIQEHIEFHKRVENRSSAGRDDQLLRRLRADRFRILLLAAAIQLDASRASTDVESVGRRITGAERAVDSLYALRSDFEENGAVPWPVAIDQVLDESDSSPNVAPGESGWPGARTFIGAWYSAAVARLQELVELRLGPALIARGLVRVPGHPDLLLAEGSYIETRVALARVDTSLASQIYSSDVRRRWRNDRQEAADAYESAMRAARPAWEAAVRLARVRLMDREPENARELLDQVLEREVPDHLRYLALLFRAAVAEQSGDLHGAAADYRAALKVRPRAQTPMLALSRIADEQNRPEEAREWADRAVAESSAGRDPWRGYIQGQAWKLDSRMADLRNMSQR